MSSISNRLGKLEREQLEASIRGARPVADLPDRELIEAILHSEGIEISNEELDAQLERFKATGEMPGMPGVTLEDLVARGRGDSKAANGAGCDRSKRRR